MARTVRRRRYEVTEMYALIEISNQMLEWAVRPLAAGARLVVRLQRRKRT